MNHLSGIDKVFFGLMFLSLVGLVSIVLGFVAIIGLAIHSFF